MDFYSKFKRIIILGFLFLVSCFLTVFFLWQGIYLPKDVKFFEEKPFFIKKGESIFQIAENLEKDNLIKNRIYFEIYLFLTEKIRKLQAGEYLLSSAMTIPEITNKIVSGDVAKVIIIIPEGFNLKEIVTKLSGSYPDSDEIEEMRVSDFWDDFELLQDARPQASLEGFLFPDTYHFSYEANVQEIVRKILTNFDKKMTSNLRKEINNQGKPIFEIVTMASMLEREVKTFGDKKLVSGILWKRLKNNIPLQVDATITYITGKKTIKISKEETEIDSPYNTYKYPGLPLGPICNPGLNSIIAAIYPEESEYWYYLSTPDGETIFSETLEEHNIAKAKYLK